MRLYQACEIIELRQRMWSSVISDEPYELALMTKQYAEIFMSMASGANNRIDRKIGGVVSRLTDIANKTMDGEINANQSFFLSCAYVDTFILKELQPYMQKMYGETFVPCSIWARVIVGEA